MSYVQTFARIIYWDILIGFLLLLLFFVVVFLRFFQAAQNRQYPGKYPGSDCKFDRNDGKSQTYPRVGLKPVMFANLIISDSSLIISVS